VSGSSLFRRDVEEPRSVEARVKERDDLGLALLTPGDAGRVDFFGDLVGDLVGEGGSEFEYSYSSSSSAVWCFLDDFLPKSFIEPEGSWKDRLVSGHPSRQESRPLRCKVMPSMRIALVAVQW
jgi:hypothetical protein